MHPRRSPGGCLSQEVDHLHNRRTGAGRRAPDARSGAPKPAVRGRSGGQVPVCTVPISGPSKHQRVEAKDPFFPGHFRSERYRMGLEPVRALVRNARKRHLCDCRPGWEAKTRPRVRSSTHAPQRLVRATCQPLQWSGSSAENSSPERGRRTTTRTSPTTTRPRQRSLRSPGFVDAVAHEPCGGGQCKGTRATAPGSQRCSSQVSGSGPCLRRHRAVVAARAIRRPVRPGAGWPLCRTAAP